MKALIDTTYDELRQSILEKYKELCKERGIYYVENENDEQTLIAEAAAYRLYLLLQDFNIAYENLFLENAKGDQLDKIAKNYFGVTRLEGAKPSAMVTFELVGGSRGVDTIFETNSQFRSNDGDTAYLRANVIIKAGAVTGTGTLILNKLVESSNVKTIIPVQVRPFAFNVKVTEFKNGRGKEEDESLRKRCLDSLYIPSTAGSRASYIYHTKTADRRIEQVNVYKSAACTVAIRYYAPVEEELAKREIKSNVEKEFGVHDDQDKLKKYNNFIKPLGIKLDIAAVKEKKYKLKAKVTLREDVSISTYTNKILEETKRELSKLAKINETITNFQILNIIGIDENVLDVELTITDEHDRPLKDKNDTILEDIICNEEEIPILDNLELLEVENYGT